MRNALPKAAYIGFTGTPLFKGDEITRRVFGSYVSKYDFQRAVEDGATVPLYYDARGEKLGDCDQRPERAHCREARRAGAARRNRRHQCCAAARTGAAAGLPRHHGGTRLDKIARDFVEHYSTQWESGKAMFVAIDKITAVRMHGLIQKHWKERIARLEKELSSVSDEQGIGRAETPDRLDAGGTDGGCHQ